MLKFVKGIVISCQFKTCEIYNEEYKICQFNLNLPKLDIGSFVKFIPM